MKKAQASVVMLLAVNLFCLSAQAGLVKGAAKGLGKGTKAVVGCADRGVKGVGKGAKTVVGFTGNGVKCTAGGVGKAANTTL
jgi:hypothetical protein